MLKIGYCWHAGLCSSPRTTVCFGPWSKRPEREDLGNGLFPPSHVPWIVGSKIMFPRMMLHVATVWCSSSVGAETRVFAATLLLWCSIVVWHCDWNTDFDVYAVPDGTLVDHRSWSCLTDCVRQLLPVSLAVVTQHGTALLSTFAMHLRMRYAAAQALYVDSFRQDTGNKELIA